MSLPVPLLSVLDYVRSVSDGSPEVTFTLTVMVITPVKQIELIMPSNMSTLMSYSANNTTEARIEANVQPGVYINDILPHRDNLYIEITKTVGYTQVTKRYRATVVGDTNPQVASNTYKLANTAMLDETTINTVSFILIETGYALLKDEMVSDIHFSTNLANVLIYQLATAGQKLNLSGPDAFKGVNIEGPVDNDKIFSQVVIPGNGTKVTGLAKWFQESEEYGIYSTGLGSFYTKGMWYIYPLYRGGRYDRAKRVLNIYKVPSDFMPVVEQSYRVNGKVVTIISNNGGDQIDGTDVTKQNKGVGKRILTAEGAFGEDGYHYSKGRAVKTREDVLTEVKTSNRNSGEEFIPFHPVPTNNSCRILSQHAANDGTMLTVTWLNSDIDLLEPAMPVRYYYTLADKLVYKEGVLHGVRADANKTSRTSGVHFKENSTLLLFLENEIIESA